MLIPSKPDDIALPHAVKEKIKELRDIVIRTAGVDLKIPGDLELDAKRMNLLLDRYAKADFRHTEAEKRSVRAIAQWSLNLKQIVCRQPVTQIEWGD